MAHPSPRGPQTVSELETPKRWQFNLSTAVLFALASGLLLYLNMNPRSEYVLCYLADDNKLKQNFIYGFPSAIDWRQETICNPSSTQITQIRTSHTFTLPNGPSVHVRQTE
jgi:hypothetical protein